MLRASELTLSVPGRLLARGLTLEIGPGELWAVLGRNGAGKSTLMHVLAGLTEPQHGCVQLDGRPLSQVSARQRARELALLLQLEEGTFWGSALEYVLLGRFPNAQGWGAWSHEDRLSAQEALAELGMAGYAARRYASLSGGERQRVRIAQVLAQGARCMLLDEPLQHLDLAHQSHVVARLGARARERGQSALMVLHEPLWIGRACTHALLFDGEGGVEIGAASQILTRERLEHAYGVRLREIGGGAERFFIPDV